MADVARAAGVSVATVSKVLNGRDGVSADTISRVSDVVADLGYASSLGARSLRSRSTKVIGVLVADFEPFSTELLKGVSESIDDTGYELLAFSGGHRGGAVGWERRSLNQLGGTLIDGAIVVTPTVVDARGPVPVVAVDPHSGETDVPTVESDNAAGGVLATEYLLGLGHTRIGLLGGRPDLDSARQRERGFRQAMSAAGIPVDEDLVRVGGYKSDTVEGPARELLTSADRPTAIFVANDVSALRTVEIAQELGLSVPGDLSVIGFDNVPESAMAVPPLTTVRQPLRELGATALGMLLDLLQGREPPSRHVRLATSLVERATCGPPST